MKHLFLMLAALLTLPCAAASRTEEQPDDLTEYIERIKSSGMSELARGQIAVIAGIRIGGSRLSYRKDGDSGTYVLSYTGTKCYSPDRDPEQVRRERELFAYQVDGEVIKLKPLADFDGSGFVSTAEGSRFRNLVEFGCKAKHVIAEERGDIELICRGLMMGENEFSDMLEQYRELCARADTLGIGGFPDLPITIE